MANALFLAQGIAGLQRAPLPFSKLHITTPHWQEWFQHLKDLTDGSTCIPLQPERFLFAFQSAPRCIPCQGMRSCGRQRYVALSCRVRQTLLHHGSPLHFSWTCLRKLG